MLLTCPSTPPATTRRSPISAKRICHGVAELAAAEFGLDAAAMMSSTRGAPRAAYVRQVAMYLAHVGFALSFEAIGPPSAATVPPSPMPAGWLKTAAMTRSWTAGSRDSKSCAWLSVNASMERPMSASDRGADKSTRRPKSRPAEVVDRFRAQHLTLAERNIMTDAGVATVLANDSESPLAWLARRKGRDGRAMISRDQFAAGERLRADFTRGNLTPRVTSNWSAPTGGRPRGSGAGSCEMTDLIITSRQRVRLALQACGPEFSGLLMDVCCFLRGLEDVERERGWPPRSAKVVLQLALDRLARHYGLASEARAGASAHVRTWLANDATFTSG